MSGLPARLSALAEAAEEGIDAARGGDQHIGADGKERSARDGEGTADLALGALTIVHGTIAGTRAVGLGGAACDREVAVGVEPVAFRDDLPSAALDLNRIAPAVGHEVGVGGVHAVVGGVHDTGTGQEVDAGALEALRGLVHGDGGAVRAHLADGEGVLGMQRVVGDVDHVGAGEDREVALAVDSVGSLELAVDGLLVGGREVERAGAADGEVATGRVAAGVVNEVVVVI